MSESEQKITSQAESESKNVKERRSKSNQETVCKSFYESSWDIPTHVSYGWKSSDIDMKVDILLKSKLISPGDIVQDFSIHNLKLLHKVDHL